MRTQSIVSGACFVEALGGSTTPVFTDASGVRLTVLQWVTRCLVACIVLLGAAVVFTLVTHVRLPGLEGLAPPPSTAGSPQDVRGRTPGEKNAVSGGEVFAGARELASGSDSRRGTALVAGASLPRTTTASATSASASVSTPQPKSGGGAVEDPPMTRPQLPAKAAAPATARSSNSHIRSDPHATNTETHASPKAVAAREAGGPPSAPPGRTK